MAKTKPSEDDWEGRDAMHAMMRAGKIVKDKKLMERVRKEAKKHSEEMAEVSDRAGQLARRGMISDKQMAKLKGNKGNQGGDARDLDKTAHLANGNEGDPGKSRTQRGIAHR